MPESEFSGRVVCVAGASRGIGRAVAEAFARAGARLLLLARSPELLAAAKELSAFAEVLPVICDVSGFAEVQAAFDRAALQWPAVEVLVNSAAVLGATGEIWRTDPICWEAALKVNLLGTYNTMRAVLPAMLAGGRGKIVNFAGGGAAYGYPLFSSYGASKAAVVRLTETAAMECAAYGVRINVLAPGAIETDLLRQVRAAGGEVRTSSSMQQAVEAVLYLASDQSCAINGRFVHARDSYREWTALPDGAYRLRRMEP